MLRRRTGKTIRGKEGEWGNANIGKREGGQGKKDEDWKRR